MNQASHHLPRIGLTIGDPAGIGPEVTLKAALSEEVCAVCDPVIIGDAAYLNEWAAHFGLPQLPATQSLPTEIDAPLIYDLKNLAAPIEMGVEQAAAGRAAAETIETAVRLCQSGELDAMTTAPINKQALHMAGVPFPGHTEYLAHLTDTNDFAMTFIAPNLRVALLTTHIPLNEVANQVKQAALEKLIRLIHRELAHYGFAEPRIAVAALNPHGAEGGLFGVEEAAEMLPAITACRTRDHINVTGPHSGDTVFLRAARGEFDIVLSCYHDQGLIPIKCMAFGEAVNVTLGLPFLRTSVDHGTAFDIAGKGVADHGSMIAAIKLAAEFYRRAHPIA